MTITSEERSESTQNTEAFETIDQRGSCGFSTTSSGLCIVFIVFALVTTLIVASTVGNSKPTRQIGSGNKNGKEVPWPSCRVRRLACPFQMALS